MRDPFEALRAPVTPASPNPAFRDRLRERISRALYLPEGVTVSNIDGERGLSSPDAQPAERIRHGDVGYASLWVPDVRRATAFFGAVLGWTYRPGSAEQGRQVEGTSPHQGVWEQQGRSTLFLCFAVDSVEDAAERVRAAGGEAGELEEQPYGRLVNCADDQGARFAMYEPPQLDPGPRPALNGERQGDISYITMLVGDSARARAFYGSVLGWRFSPGRVEDGWQVEGVAPMTGMAGGAPAPAVLPMYRVDDVHDAVRRARDAGGSSTEVTRQPYGLTAECADDEGTRFYLGQL